MHNKLNPKKIRAARVFEGLSITELSEKIGVSKQAISQFELGELTPGLETLMKIKNTLGFPIEYFYMEENNEVVIGNTFFRSLMSAKKIFKDQQEQKLKELSRIYNILEEYISFPSLNLPNYSDINYETLTDKDIEQIAYDLRKYWKLGMDPIADMVYVLEVNGIVVSEIQINQDNIDALSQRQVVNGKPRYFILLGNDKTSAARRNFNAAHELGHIILHSMSIDIENLTSDEYKHIEHQANLFAACFLLPREAFLKDLKVNNKIEFYIELKKKWKVSISAMIIRAYDLRVLNRNQYQYLFRKMNTLGYRKKEPLDDVIKIPKPALLQKAIEMIVVNNVLEPDELISSIKLTKGKIEQLLCLSSDVLKTVFKEPASLLRLVDTNYSNAENY